MKRWLPLVAWMALLGSALPAHEHKPSDSYLTLRIDGERIDGQWDIALRDLDFAIGLDADQDGDITWGEVKTKHGDIAAYALSRLRVGPANAPCPAHVTGHLVDNHSDGAYAVLVRFPLPGGRWQAAGNFRAAFWDVVKVVTAFTLAHSITLSLAALSVVSLPSRLVESAIALSVVLAALNNLRPLVFEKRWVI